MDSPEYERERVARVKELEEMVKKLEQENQQLLTRVKTSVSESTGRQQVRRSSSGVASEGGKKKDVARLNSLGDMESDVINLEGEGGASEKGEDEWLFVSPLRPPNPLQKQLSPLKWLSEGHNKSRAQEIPSLDDVRKVLSFTINEAENLSREPGAESPPPPLRAKNKTAKKYLNQVRRRRHSPPTIPQDENQQQSQDPGHDNVGTEEKVPVINWRARVAMSPTSDEVENEAVPRVRWKARMPGDGPTSRRPPANHVTGSEEEEEKVPKISWKRPVQVPSDDDIPRVKWTPRAAKEPKNEEVTNTLTDEHVPRIQWTPRHVASPPGEHMEREESISKLNWRSPARLPSPRHSLRKYPPAQAEELEGEEVPRRSWRTPVVPSSHEDDAVPVVNIITSKLGHTPTAAKTRNIPVKAVMTYRTRRPEEDQLSDDSFGSSDLERNEVGTGILNGGYSDPELSLEDESNRPVQRVSRYQAHHSGLQYPSNAGQSPLQYRGTSPGSGSNRRPRPVGTVSPQVGPNLRSRSASPLLRYSPKHRPIIRSRSPSPSVSQGSQLSSSLLRSPQTTGPKQILPPKSPTHHGRSPRSVSPAGKVSTPPQTSTPSGSNRNPVQGRKKIISPSNYGPQTPRSTTAPTPASTTQPSTSSAGRHPSGLPHHPSSVGSRTTPARTSLPSPSSRANSHGRDLSPRSGGTGVRSSARTSLDGGGSRPAQQAQQQQGVRKVKRALPSSTHSGGARSSSGGQRREQGAPQQRRPVKQVEQPDPDDDSWLEGCY